MLVDVEAFREFVDKDQIFNLPKPFLRRDHDELTTIEYDLRICGGAGAAPFPACASLAKANVIIAAAAIAAVCCFIAAAILPMSFPNEIALTD
jgi:hypothetical protein